MIELFIAAFLILLNGVFALSELAVVSSRKPRLNAMVERRVAGAGAAMTLMENPGRFLSTVQIGITLVGILAGAFSGAALGERLGAFLVSRGISPRVADLEAYILVIGGIAFFSVIIGELVPKHLALKAPERLACMVAPTMLLLSRAAAPLVWLLDASTRFILWALRISAQPESSVTEEEIKTVVAEAESAGIIESEEQSMITAIMRLSDRTVRAVMTPRTDVDMIDLKLPDAELRRILLAAKHSHLPAFEGNPDEILGVIVLREMVESLSRRKKLDLRPFVRQASIIPDTLEGLDGLKVLREAEIPVALVHDEYGHFEGILTPADMLDAIAGAFRSDTDDAEPEAFQREDGSWLIAGWMPADEMADLLFLSLPQKRGYDTAAGFLIDQFQRIPDLGDAIDIGNWRFEIVDLDGRRIDKVLATRLS
ncbi:MAG: HlyC/CorC family transporter [Rhizobiaceae bacterium]|nr:MAG: HlyC/CorC family transporter [Rhizobiaceae bacterium]